MSIKPCDAHGSTVRGRLGTVYPALVRDGLRYSNKLNLCFDCIRDLVSLHTADWLDSALKTDLDRATACSRCDAEAGNNKYLYRFYATAFLNGKDRRDYSAMYCQACADEVSLELRLHA